MTELNPSSTYTQQDFIPMEVWGRDHWSLLGYINHHMVDVACFHVGFDPHMRQNRYNYMGLLNSCHNPKRSGWNKRSKDVQSQISMVMKSEHGSRLNNGEYIPNHDDWCCVQDMADAGLFKNKKADDIQPKNKLMFSEKGNEIVNQLLIHKRNGGSFADFKPRLQEKNT